MSISPETVREFMGPKLLPCPFCGGKAWINRYKRVTATDNPGVRVTHIQCDSDNDCKVTVDIESINEALAVEAWNRRSGVDAQQVLDPAEAEHLKHSLASAIHYGRFPTDREPTAFAMEDESGREYCLRIARTILARFDVRQKSTPYTTKSTES